MSGIDILGYVASLLVAVSLSMGSIARMRFVNLLGAVAFSGYGWLAGAYPVMAVNAYVVVINVVFLLKMQRATVQLSNFWPSNARITGICSASWNFTRMKSAKFFRPFIPTTFRMPKLSSS